MSNVRRWVLAVAALPLLYLPLRAAETPPATPPESAPAEAAAQTPSDVVREVEPVAAERPPPRRSEPDPGERLSLDNNLSFPVDI